MELTRRSFLQGLSAVGATVAVAGCSSSSDESEVYVPEDLTDAVEEVDLTNLTDFDRTYTACPHNCGPAVRCASQIWSREGRIYRVTSDDNDGYDRKNLYDPRNLNCAKGRSFKHRSYHTGRLKYPMKQTKKRGDMTGFVRISWEEAFDESIRKYRAIFAKYGTGAIYGSAGNGSGFGADSGSVLNVITANGANAGTFSDHSFHQWNYGYNLAGVPGSTSYSNAGIGSQVTAVAGGAIKHWVSFGTNSMTTNNTLSYAYLRANQKAKENNSDFKHYVIAPELSDTGVLNATDWVQIRNQTDPALIAGMFHEMLVNTFNADGSIKANPWLDVDYIDTVLYGFFDSPEYWIKTGTPNVGTISLTDPGVGYRKINAVPAGRSYASWVLGNGGVAANAKYTNADNYTGKSFGDFARTAPCSWPVNGKNANTCSATELTASKYYTKRDYLTPKTPEWAEKICGTPAATIRELARFFTDEANKPFMTEWTGGLQKSENGVITLFAIQTLFAATKNWGWSHGSTGTFYQTWASSPGMQGTYPAFTQLPAIPTAASVLYATSGTSSNASVPSISCKEHFQGLMMAFKEELESKGFDFASNPYWDGETRYLNDDAGAKTLIVYKKNATGVAQTFYNKDSDGVVRQYTDYVGRPSDGHEGTLADPCENAGEGTPVFSGKRFYHGGAGVLINQVANTTWATDIMSKLEIASKNPDDPDTFCMIVATPHLTPQVRFADYVFPVVLESLEKANSGSVGGASNYRFPAITTAPGEAKTGYEASFIGWQVAEALGDYSGTRIDGADPIIRKVTANAALSYAKITDKSEFKTIEEQYKKILEDAVAPGGTLNYAGFTSVRDAVAQQIGRKTGSAETLVTTATKSNTTRTNLDAYLADETNRTTTPFVTFATGRQFTPSTNNNMAGNIMVKGETPGVHGRMTCYAEYAIRIWENAYAQHHAWLPLEKRGQVNIDAENDPMLYPIPMYMAFEDGFNEMYGVLNRNASRRNIQTGWKMIGSKPATNDISLITDKLTVTVGSTHGRWRSHSSQAELPFLREISHRTKGGSANSGNDWNEYLVIPNAEDTPKNTPDIINPMLSTAIQKKNMKTASWSEFWLNAEDCAAFDIKDGDLLRVSNPVGAVRVVARVTDRIVRGHAQLHQGAWFDPNPMDGVDDGGAANTLMSNRPSKFDNGNSLHCAYCVVEKETSF